MLYGSEMLGLIGSLMGNLERQKANDDDGEEGCETDVLPMTEKIDILLAQRTIFELMVSVLKRNILLTFSSSNNNCKLFLRKIREIIDQCLKYCLLLIVFYN